MKKRTEQSLTKLANAAFEQASRKVIERAEATGTPVIIFEAGEIKEVSARKARRGLGRARTGKRK